MLTVEERASSQKFLKAIRKRSDPNRPRDPCAVSRRHPSPAIKDTRALLAEAKMLAVEVPPHPAFGKRNSRVACQQGKLQAGCIVAIAFQR